MRERAREREYESESESERVRASESEGIGDVYTGVCHALLQTKSKVILENNPNYLSEWKVFS